MTIERDLYSGVKRDRLESWKLMKQAQNSGALDAAAHYGKIYENATKVLLEIGEV